MTEWIVELRRAARGLARTPGFTAAAVLTLGVGLGGAATVIALADGVLSPLPYPDPGRLVSVWETRAGSRRPVAPANYLDWRGATRSFAGLAAWRERDVTLTVGGTAARGTVTEVSGNFFQVLGVDAARGRTFDPAFEPAFEPREAVLAHGYWQQELGGNPDVLGRTIRVEDGAWRVIGVGPPGFGFPDGETDAWLRAPTEAPGLRGFDGDIGSLRDSRYLRVLGRLAPGATLDGAREEIQRVAADLARDWPEANRDGGADLAPLLDETVAHVRPILAALSAAVALLLLTAGVNVAHLATARAAGRRTEVAVRVALGAGRRLLLRAAFAEAWLLALGGAAVGVGIGAAGLAGATAALGSALPRRPEIALSGATVVVLVGVATLMALGVAAIAFVAAGAGRLRPDRLRGRGTGGARARDGMVVAQVAVAVTLLATSGVLARSLWLLAAVDPGIDPDGLVTLRLALPDARSLAFEERLDRYGALADVARGVPGVAVAGLGASGPLESSPSAGLRAVGVADEGDPPDVTWHPVEPGYFEAVGLRLVRGRGLEASDAAGAAEVGLLNETAARQRFGSEDPIGREVTIGMDGHDRPITVVGIVADARTRGPASPAGPVLYRPLAQTRRLGGESMVLAVRTAGRSATSAMVSRLRAAAPEVPVYDVRTGPELVAGFVRGRTGVLGILAAFAASALLLGAVGVHGVASYGVRTRRREIGVRLALGADRRDILGRVVGGGLARALPGIPVGLALSLATGRALSPLLHRVSAVDPWTWAGATVLVASVTAAALFVPARAAASVESAEALRSD